MPVMAKQKPKPMHDLFARIPEEVFQEMKALAQEHNRSVAKEVMTALQEYIRAQRGRREE